MISLSDLTMRFGTQVLFENVAWRLNPGGHYGLVGANGTGKSTLLHLMSGELKPESGQISRANDLRLGILEQDH
ncbi:MAG: ATP-binding cassette domain-containing protein, partial [SAR324 cluster bacterium]|nr:ATP-binding cassette domain-containing protein [SAR324 cluster bacterium]